MRVFGLLAVILFGDLSGVMGFGTLVLLFVVETVLFRPFKAFGSNLHGCFAIFFYQIINDIHCFFDNRIIKGKPYNR